MPDENGNPTPEETAAAEAAAAQTAELAALREQVTGQAGQLAAATADYGDVARAANPDLPEAVFTGDSIAAIKTSVASARAVADHVKATATPAVAPAPAVTPPPAPAARTPEAATNLRGADRIRDALNRS